MKKYLLILLLLFTMNTDASAQLTTNEKISAIEDSVFGYDYKNEAESKRLERIEKHLYGETKSGDLKKRLENIQNDTGFVVRENIKESAKNNIQNNQNITAQNNIQNQIPNIKEDESVEYPIVDKMEEEIFHTTYKKENIYSRLNRLEEKVYNKTSSEDLNTRVNNLASVIAPVKMPSKQPKNYDMQDMNAYYGSSGLEQINDQTIPFQLAVLEEDLLRGSYTNENISNRLSRLEQKLFSRTFSSDTDITRLQRIMVAYDAKKNSYKYENNRKMQNMATLSQIGGILLMILAILL